MPPGGRPGFAKLTAGAVRFDLNSIRRILRVCIYTSSIYLPRLYFFISKSSNFRKFDRFFDLKFLIQLQMGPFFKLALFSSEFVFLQEFLSGHFIISSPILNFRSISRHSLKKGIRIYLRSENIHKKMILRAWVIKYNQILISLNISIESLWS